MQNSDAKAQTTKFSRRKTRVLSEGKATLRRCVTEHGGRPEAFGIRTERSKYAVEFWLADVADVAFLAKVPLAEAELFALALLECQRLAQVKLGAVSTSATTARTKQYRKDHCGRCDSVSNLHVHHRDRNSTNNNPGNLETLCGRCHGLEHVNDRWYPERIA